MSYDYKTFLKPLADYLVSIPLEQGSVLRRNDKPYISRTESQSLWNRAVSYDSTENGDLRLIALSQSLWNRAVSYDWILVICIYLIGSLNPFGTGQCLTTKANITTATTVQESQSLWNRAVSYDKYRINVGYYETVSIPLEQGSVLRQFLILLEIK